MLMENAIINVLSVAYGCGALACVLIFFACVRSFVATFLGVAGMIVDGVKKLTEKAKTKK